MQSLPRLTAADEDRSEAVRLRRIGAHPTRPTTHDVDFGDPQQGRRDAPVVVAIAPTHCESAVRHASARERKVLHDVHVRRTVSVHARAVQGHVDTVSRDLSSLLERGRADPGSADPVGEAVQNPHARNLARAARCRPLGERTVSAVRGRTTAPLVVDREHMPVPPSSRVRIDVLQPLLDRGRIQFHRQRPVSGAPSGPRDARTARRVVARRRPHIRLFTPKTLGRMLRGAGFGC